MNELYQISSGENGKCCDFFPHGSLHLDLKRIHTFCEIEKARFPQEVKKCKGGCDCVFPINWPFVEPNQKGDVEMCLRCHEKKYIINRENYHKALRETILIELKDKGLLKEV